MNALYVFNHDVNKSGKSFIDVTSISFTSKRTIRQNIVTQFDGIGIKA
jgi:hypothetical protein